MPLRTLLFAATFFMTGGTLMADARLGATIGEFRSLWDRPSREEVFVRTATLTWNRQPSRSSPVLPSGIFAVEVAFLDGIACEIVLRSKKRTAPGEFIELLEPLVAHFHAADFAKPKSDVNGIRIYDLSDGTSVSVKEHKGQLVIVMRSQCYLHNEDVFAREAAKIRPPTSNH